MALLAALVGQVTVLSTIPPIPDREALWAVRRSPGIAFLDRSGRPIATRGAKYGARVSLSDLPAYVAPAFLAAEDRRFYAHGPVDLRAILRAARRDLSAGRGLEGGSTLSQQLARTLFLNNEHSFRRKLQEAVLAARLEDMLGKDGVLALYLNRVYFGAGAYGLDAAAQTYFGKSARTLTLGEAALLAGLPNAPTRLAPTTDYAAAWSRARRVLLAMRGEGWISPDSLAAALAAPPALAPPRAGEGSWGPVLDRAAAEVGALANGAGDLVVRLTVDPRLQAAGEAALDEGIRRDGAGRNVSQGALLTLAPDGAILAMVGGADGGASAFNRATQARRQPGSAFKAFVFGAALERGVRPDDRRKDAPVSMAGWSPTNYGGRFAGEVTLQTALARSINTVSVRLTEEVGPAQVAEFARRFGLVDIPANPGPSIALGAYEVTLLQLAGGYQVFQSGGIRTGSYLVAEIRNTRGATIWSRNPASPAQVYDRLYASRMVRMLKSVIADGTGAAADIGRPAAGKTGTSQNWRDAWFVGFTPDLLTAVWVGNDNGAPMNKVTGGEIPARIWRRFMSVAEAEVQPVDFAWLEPEPAPPDETTAVQSGPGEDQPLPADAEGTTPAAPISQMDDDATGREGPAQEDEPSTPSAPAPPYPDHAPLEGDPRTR
jgi:penicillin-binding protein 1A